jgi:hypothetical protein
VDPMSNEEDDAAEDLAGIGSRTNFRSTTPSNLVDGAADGGIGTTAPEDYCPGSTFTIYDTTICQVSFS